MTDATSNTPAEQAHSTSLLVESPLMKKRNAAEARFRIYGVTAT